MIKLIISNKPILIILIN